MINKIEVEYDEDAHKIHSKTSNVVDVIEEMETHLKRARYKLNNVEHKGYDIAKALPFISKAIKELSILRKALLTKSDDYITIMNYAEEMEDDLARIFKYIEDSYVKVNLDSDERKEIFWHYNEHTIKAIIGAVALIAAVAIAVSTAGTASAFSLATLKGGIALINVTNSTAGYAIVVGQATSLNAMVALPGLTYAAGTEAVDVYFDAEIASNMRNSHFTTANNLRGLSYSKAKDSFIEKNVGEDALVLYKAYKISQIPMKVYKNSANLYKMMEDRRFYTEYPFNEKLKTYEKGSEAFLRTKEYVDIPDKINKYKEDIDYIHERYEYNLEKYNIPIPESNNTHDNTYQYTSTKKIRYDYVVRGMKKRKD